MWWFYVAALNELGKASEKSFKKSADNKIANNFTKK